MKRALLLFLLSSSCGTSSTPDGGADATGDAIVAPDGGTDSMPSCTGVDLATDPANCGACAHDCGGGACTMGVCQPVTLVAIATIGYGIAVDDATVFWTSPFGGVSSCAKSGCANPTLLSGGGLPTFIAVDSTNVYWGEYEGSGIGAGLHTCLKTGCMQSAIGVGTDGEGVVVDQGKIFWADKTSASTGTIRGCAAPGCTGSATVSSGPRATVGVATDATTVYFTNSQSPAGGIFSCPKAGCAQPTMLANNEHGPIGIAVDAMNVYWADFDDGKIASCAKTGCNAMPTTLATMQPNPFGMAVDDAFVYWANVGASKGASADGSITYCAKSACMPKTLVPALTAPNTIALDAKMLYVVTATSVVKVARPVK